ncbi:unnamed protein product [Camellia sinensis]
MSLSLLIIPIPKGAERREMEEGLLLLKEEREERRRWVWGELGEEVKRLGWIAALMVVVTLSQNLLEVVCTMMVGHLGELSLSSSAIALSLAGVSGFSLLANKFLIEIHDLGALRTHTNESKGCSSEVRTEARLSLGSPNRSKTVPRESESSTHPTLARKIPLEDNRVYQASTNRSKDCLSEVRAETRLSLGSPSGCALLLRQLMEAKAIPREFEQETRLSFRSPSRNEAVPRKSEWMCTSTSAANGSKGYPSGVRVRVHSTLKRKILGARIDEIKGCSSDLH